MCNLATHENNSRATYFGKKFYTVFLTLTICHKLMVQICRVLNVQLGETSRLAWLGVEVDPLAQSDLLKAYSRPSESVSEPSSKWFISKSAIVSGLGLLGIKQEQGHSTTEGEAPSPKVRRKRVVRKKVARSQV